MTGRMETVESQRQASHEFPPPFGNPANGGRDSHIPTAPTTGGKVENQQQVPTFPPPAWGTTNARKTPLRRSGSRPPAESGDQRMKESQRKEDLPPGCFRLMSIGNRPQLSGSFLD